ncbi:MAG: calcineurin-like phosphoesterase family protein [Tannerella sp.]|jgi:hypothetical protein|nr:calcineurin-like phosphoesterase family protein [Tannerella sp.]
MKHTVLLLLLSIFTLACGGKHERTDNRYVKVATVRIPDRERFTVKGVVVDSKNNPIGSVVVNDGFNFTQTDNNGIYYLKTNLSESRFVSISVPPAYEIETDSFIATGFYAPLSRQEKINRRDFVLRKKEKQSDQFMYIVLSDPQVRNETHLQRFRNESAADIRETLKRIRTSSPVYAAVVGDIVFDMMDLFDPYKNILKETGVDCYFHTIGNHDFNLACNAFSNTEDKAACYGEQIYESHFGPTDYSVNIGKIHIVTLKNIDYFKDKKYTERFTEDQLKWLIKDLSYVLPGSTVFINLHAPTSNQSDNGEGNTRNRLELMEILKGYKVHIFAGHTHFFENYEVTPDIYEHNIGAVCGAWWAGNVNRCGAPNGYLIVNVNGENISWQYKATGKDSDYQFRVYKPDEFISQAGYVVANVWDWDMTYQVKWYEDGILKGEMEQFADEDQDYITMHGKAAGYKTLHLFRAKPAENTKQVTVEVCNRFEQTFKQTVVL